MYFAKSKKNTQQGFTLLEVMVALLIVSLALITLVKGAAEKVNVANDLRDKTFAQWVAINKITEWRTMKTLPKTNRASGTQNMGTEEWFWFAKFLKTDNKNIFKAEIHVYENEQNKEDKKQPLIKLTTYISNV